MLIEGLVSTITSFLPERVLNSFFTVTAVSFLTVIISTESFETIVSGFFSLQDMISTAETKIEINNFFITGFKIHKIPQNASRFLTIYIYFFIVDYNSSNHMPLLELIFKLIYAYI